MITSYEEYQKELGRIKDGNPPSTALLIPSTEQIYEINLNSRKFESPEILSLTHDHHSETFYFKMDRFFDTMDLTNTCGVIQYKNAIGKERIYPIPFYDVSTFNSENKIVFPWRVGREATAAAGTVEFSFRFYTINQNTSTFDFCLNTLTGKSKVLQTMDVSNVEDYDYPAEVVEEIYARLSKIEQDYNLYWLEI